MYQWQQHNNDGPSLLQMRVGELLSPHINTNTIPPPSLQTQDGGVSLLFPSHGPPSLQTWSGSTFWTLRILGNSLQFQFEPKLGKNQTRSDLNTLTQIAKVHIGFDNLKWDSIILHSWQCFTYLKWMFNTNTDRNESQIIITAGA